MLERKKRRRKENETKNVLLRQYIIIYQLEKMQKEK